MEMTWELYLTLIFLSVIAATSYILLIRRFFISSDRPVIPNLSKSGLKEILVNMRPSFGKSLGVIINRLELNTKPLAANFHDVL
mgnify:CR=1 FL=1